MSKWIQFHRPPVNPHSLSGLQPHPTPIQERKLFGHLPKTIGNNRLDRKKTIIIMFATHNHPKSTSRSFSFCGPKSLRKFWSIMYGCHVDRTLTETYLCGHYRHGTWYVKGMITPQHASLWAVFTVWGVCVRYLSFCRLFLQIFFTSAAPTRITDIITCRKSRGSQFERAALWRCSVSNDQTEQRRCG